MRNNRLNPRAGQSKDCTGLTLNLDTQFWDVKYTLACVSCGEKHTDEVDIKIILIPFKANLHLLRQVFPLAGVAHCLFSGFLQ